jgi:hypothetical protein
MKLPRPLWPAVVTFTAVALLFATTDLVLITLRKLPEVLPAVLAHVVALTVVVGTWAYAMICLEDDGRRHA